MSLYAEYLKERTNDHILELEHGFATYRYIDKTTVYLVDIYVTPGSRDSGMATMMADAIAAEARGLGCTEMIGTVAIAAKNSTISLKVLLAYGMTLKQATQDGIILRKDI